MKNEVTVSEQVTQFLGALAPEPKKKLRAGIRSLDSDRGDIKDLVDALTGYKPLRVGHFRVICREAFANGMPVRKCLCAERRNVVYEVFTEILLSDLT